MYDPGAVGRCERVDGIGWCCFGSKIPKLREFMSSEAFTD